MIDWATEISPWEAVIETGRNIWGDKWTFFVLANLAAGIRSNQETCSSFTSLFDENASLARRVRYARLRSASEKWWREQLTLSKTIDQRELGLLVCLTWARSALLLALQDLLTPLLDELPEERWERLFQAVRHCRHLANQRTVAPDELDVPK